VSPISGRWKTGLALTILSMIFWGSQPLAIAMIKSIPYSTLAFYKISSAAVLALAYLFCTRRLPRFELLKQTTLMGLAVAGASLAVSYVCFNSSFKYISPANVQIYFQFSRIFMALAGLFLFKEVFTKIQWFGLATVCFGLGLFFHAQLGQYADELNYPLGVGLVLASAGTWALYAIMQKLLLQRLSALQILAAVYVMATLCLTPYAEVTSLIELGRSEWMALAFVCLSNVLAFACFSQSLNHWESAKIGTISCLTPLVTIALMYILAGDWLHSVRPERLGVASVIGTSVSIFGSILVISRNRG